MHSQENAQKPQIEQFHWVKLVQKTRKSTDRDYNLISSEVGHHAQYQTIHSMVIREMPGNPKSDPFRFAK